MTVMLLAERHGRLNATTARVLWTVGKMGGLIAENVCAAMYIKATVNHLNIQGFRCYFEGSSPE